MERLWECEPACAAHWAWTLEQHSLKSSEAALIEGHLHKEKFQNEIGHEETERAGMARWDVDKMQRLDWIWKVFLKEEDRGSDADRNLWEMRCDWKGVMQGAEPAPN